MKTFIESTEFKSYLEKELQKVHDLINVLEKDRILPKESYYERYT